MLALQGYIGDLGDFVLEGVPDKGAEQGGKRSFPRRIRTVGEIRHTRAQIRWWLSAQRVTDQCVVVRPAVEWVQPGTNIFLAKGDKDESATGRA
jgi:hypothetical protein